MKVALVVRGKGVAGQIPAVSDIGVLPLVGEITAAGGPANRKLADLAVWLFCHVVADDLGLVAADRFSRRGRRRIAEPVGNENVQHFGRADAVQDRLAGFPLHSSKTGPGSVSPAETATRSEDRSAPSCMAPSTARYAVGAVNEMVAL